MKSNWLLSAIPFAVIITVTAFLSSSIAMSAPSPNRVFGTVVDEGGGAVAGAKVSLLNVKGATERAAMTDSSGNFSMPDVAGGKYTIRIEQTNFETSETPIDVGPNSPSELIHITLHVAAVRETVKVTADLGDRLTGYSAKDATSATKLDTPILETPLATQIVTRETLDDRQTITLMDAVSDNVSSVSHTVQFYDDFTIRGFNVGQSIYRDGLIIQDVTGLETANVQSVEVLKGPAAVLYGRLEPGGIVSINTKRPLMDSYYSLEEEAGSFGETRTTLDATGPLTQDHKLAYRVGLAYNQADSFRDFVSSQNIFVAPAISYQPFERFHLNIGGEYQNLNFLDDESGIPAIGNRPAKIPISRYLGEPSTRHNGQNRGLFAYDWTLGLSKDWSLVNRLSYNDVTYSQLAAIVATFNEVTGDMTRSVWSPADFFRRTLATNLELTGRFSTGQFHHYVLVGFDFRRYAEEGYQYNGYTVGPINIYDPVYNGITASGPITNCCYSTDHEGWEGLYFQDMISFAHDKLHLLLGGREDWAYIGYGNGNSSLQQANGSYDPSTGFGFVKSHDTAFSPRLGLVYQPKPWLSLYGNYTKSFGATNALPYPGQPLFPPETGTQYEGGVKTEFFHKRVSASTAFFNITKTNVLTLLPGGIFAVPLGEVRSRGVELDVTGQLNRNWSVVGTYDHDDALVVKGANVSSFSLAAPGNRLESVPANAGNVWLKYDFLRRLNGLSLGAGLAAVGQRQGDNANDFQLPGYARFDGMIGYHFTPEFLPRARNLTLQVNVRNLFDKTYYESSTGFGTYSPDPAINSRITLITPGAPRNFLVAMRVEF
jgi:iron complex outermembrane receptor protein